MRYLFLIFILFVSNVYADSSGGSPGDSQKAGQVVYSARGGNVISFPSSDTTSGGSIAIGHGALAHQPVAAAYYNVAIGYNALSSSSMTTAAIRNTTVGANVLYSNTTGSSNAAFGFNALYYNTTGGSNVAIGYQALYNNTTGGNNTANGYDSLLYNTTGNNNAANGMYSLYNNTTGSYNTANGYYSLYSNTTNVATLGSITGGSSYTPGTYNNVVMTLSSGSSAVTYPTANIVVNSSGNVSSVTIVAGLAGVGFKDTTTVLTAPASSIGGTGSGFSVPVATLHTGGNNTAYGNQAGRYISGGSTVNSWSTNSLYLGMSAYPLADGDINETVIGYGAVGNGSNTVTIGGTGTTANLFPYGKVGIGTSSPNYTLEINGSLGVEGHIQTNGTAPTLTSCGGSPSIVGNDNSFTITVGTTATGCTATFATAWTNSPSCTVTNQSTSITNAMTYTVSASAVVVSQAAGLSGDILNVVCQGYY